MLYAYRCLKCGSKFEISIKVSELDKTLVTCSKCHSKVVRKIIQMPSVRFTGSGFYSTDNRKKENDPTT